MKMLLLLNPVACAYLECSGSVWWCVRAGTCLLGQWSPRHRWREHCLLLEGRCCDMRNYWDYDEEIWLTVDLFSRVLCREDANWTPRKRSGRACWEPVELIDKSPDWEVLKMEKAREMLWMSNARKRNGYTSSINGKNSQCCSGSQQHNIFEKDETFVN